MKPASSPLSAILIGGVTLAFWIGAPSCRSTAEPEQGERPNVILIMTDDQGWGDFGFQGNRAIRTPHLDRMAAGSATLETFYVSPVCTPTRAALMTGRAPQRTRAIDTWIGRAMMEPDEVTVAELLRDAGWATGIFGKWHLGDCYPMRAMDQGFEESLVHRGGGIGQPADPEGGEGKYTNPVLHHNGERVEAKGYCTDVYFDAALEWMSREARDDQPFFAYIATNAPHGPFHDVPEELYQDYLAADLSPAAFPASPGHALPETHDEDRLARIFAMITNVDDNVGRLFAKLEELGELENTLVIFLDDNGPNSRRWVGGMRGMKSEVYEGGVRSPFLVHWPARLAPGVASDRVTCHMDVLPTILEACGVAAPRDLELDGRSFLPLLERRDVDWAERTIAIQAHRGNRATRYHNFFLRNGRWKLLNASGFGRARDVVEPDFELYDLEADPLEENNVAAAHPEVVARLRADYDEWFDDVGSTRPDNYAPPPIVLGSPASHRADLTRQDWRPTKGDGWGQPYSQGDWLVRVVHSGPYDVRVRFLDSQVVEHADLQVGESTWESVLAPDQRECTLEGVHFPIGDARLRVTLRGPGEPAGPYQVHVTRVTDE